jgi:hypothetical protein
VKVGTIDNADFVKPEVNLFITHALDCTHIDDELANFDGMPPPA